MYMNGEKNMKFKTNSTVTTRSLTEWFFGKDFVKEKTLEAEKASRETGKKEFRFWQEGTGYLTIIL